MSGCPSGPPYGPANKSGAALLDTKAGTITQYTLPWDMFCNGMIVLPDGRPFILGGTESYDSGDGFTGLPYTATYDPATGIFSGQQAMAHGRWYPTAIVLGDGRVMVLSGAISGPDHHDQSLIWQRQQDGRILHSRVRMESGVHRSNRLDHAPSIPAPARFAQRQGVLLGSGTNFSPL